MTTALVALSRAYTKLPGARPHNVTDDGWRINRTTFRREDGTLWVCVDGAWTLDLTDPATGGVMLSAIAPVVMPVIDCDPRTGFALRAFGQRFAPGSGRPTLAEAIAHFAVAMGRAG